MTELREFARIASENEIKDRFSAAASKVRYGAGATRKQVDFLTSLCLRNDAGRAIYQDFVCNTSGLLPLRKASRMIDKLLAI